MTYRALRLAIEMQPVRLPRPTALAVFGEGPGPLGYLDIDHVRAILKKWDEMIAAREEDAKRR